MRVLVVSNLYPPFHIGGYEISCRDSVELLSSAGVDCRVLTSDFVDYSLDAIAISADDQQVRRRLKLHVNWGTSYKQSSFGAASRHNWACLNEEIAEFAPDIIYTWNLYGLGALTFGQLPPSTSHACVHHFMDLSLFPRAAHRGRPVTHRLLGAVKRAVKPSAVDLTRNGLAPAGTHVYASEFIRQAIARDVTPRRAVVLYPPVHTPDEMPVKREFRLDRRNVRCVYLGQVAPHKGVEVMLEAIRRVASTGVGIRAVVYGGHVDQRYCDTLLARYGDRLSIRSGLPRAQILAELADYDIGIFPSSWEEPFGMAQLELAYAALPILSSATGGAAEFGRHGITTVRFRAGDPGSLAEALVELVAGYERFAPLLSAGAAFEARRMCHSETYVRRLLALFTYVHEHAWHVRAGSIA